MDLPSISFHQHPPVIPTAFFPPSPAAAAAAVFPPASQPPAYPRMIEEAIRALNEPEGSSKRSIAKYIEGAYKDLPPTHSDLLTHCLRRLKENGDLVMVKKSYKLARSEAHLAADIPSPSPAASSGTKRGRGRPPKPQPDIFSAPNPNLVTLEAADPLPQVVLPSIAPPTEPTVPNSQPVSGGSRRRGRPKKSWPEHSLNVSKRSPGRPRKNETVGSGKGPGRPRKFPVDAAAGTAQPVSNGVKRRGRPPKDQTQPQDQPQPHDLNQSQPVPQQQFMPPQQQFMPHPPQFLPQFFTQQIQPSAMQFQAEPMVVPYADASAVVPNAPAAEVPNTPRRRGRPKRTTTPAAAGTGSATGKRRGRPPKSGGVSKPMKPRKTSGRPLGRPRKKVEGLDSQSVAASYGDLKRKLGFFQSKVMHAVGVLKPQFMSESNASAIAALQELEGLAAMDFINAPFTEEEAAQPLLPPPNGGVSALNYCGV